MRLKLKLIYLPFLLLSTGYLIGYSLVDWVFFIHPGYLSDNSVIEITTAVVLIWIPAIYILWPRIKLLDVEEGAGRRRFDHPSYFFVAIMLILVPTIFAQRYLVIASQKLISIQNIQEVKKSNITQYYDVKNWHVERNVIGTGFEAILSKHNDLDLYVYMVSPFTTNQVSNNIWLGIKYHKQISDLLTDDEKKEEIEAFKNATYNEYANNGPNGLSYMVQLGNNVNRSAYLDAINGVGNVDAPIIMEGETDIFNKRNDGNLAAAIITYLLGLLIWFGIVRLKELNEVV